MQNDNAYDAACYAYFKAYTYLCIHTYAMPTLVIMPAYHTVKEVVLTASTVLYCCFCSAYIVMLWQL